MTKTIRIIGFTVLLIVLFGALSIRGFAASNTVDGSAAGDGSAAVSGYTLSDIVYTSLLADAGKLTSVAFTVLPTAGAGPAGTVRISLDAGATWVACTNTGGNNWTCAFPGGSEPFISSLGSLRVVAVE